MQTLTTEKINPCQTFAGAISGTDQKQVHVSTLYHSLYKLSGVFNTGLTGRRSGYKVFLYNFCKVLKTDLIGIEVAKNSFTIQFL